MELNNTDYLEKIIPEKDAREVSALQREFLESYAASKDKITAENWLRRELKKHLPEKTQNEIDEISSDIIGSLRTTEKMKVSQQKAREAGRSKDSWLASTLLQSTSHMSAQEGAKYLHELDTAVKNANAAMHDTITTKSSGYTVPSLNPNLDGFIAEQYHVNSFNLEAAAKGSSLRAEVQLPKPGETYSKNGFDVVIKDASGNRVHQYQMKYGKDAEATIDLIKSGNYNNQILVVSEDQVEAVQKAFPNKTVTSIIGEGDVASKPLTKEQVKDMQNKAQESNFLETSWNDFTAKDIALGIGKQTGNACVQGAVIGAGMAVASKVLNGEPIDGEEVVESAIVSGADFGVKTAAAGALKVASEKGILKAIPKGTPGSTFANIAFVAIENLKVAGKVATGELTVKEGFDEMEQTTASCVAGLAASAKGMAIGSKIGAVLGPAGIFVGGLIGGAVGYMAGSKIAQTVVKGFQKIRDTAVEVLKEVGSGIRDGFRTAVQGVRGFLGV